VPDEFKSGVTLLGSAHEHTCASTNAVFKCWGGAAAVHTDTLTSEFDNGVLALAVGQNHSCASTNSLFKCWGIGA